MSNVRRHKSRMAKGFVYVLSNAGQPGLLKIGYSRKVPAERAAELNTTGVAEPFVVEFYCLVENDAEAEAKIHSLLAAQRYRQDREFFRLEIQEAIEAIREICPQPEHSWSRVDRDQQVSGRFDRASSRPSVKQAHDARMPQNKKATSLVAVDPVRPMPRTKGGARIWLKQSHDARGNPPLHSASSSTTCSTSGATYAGSARCPKCGTALSK